jgi:hypothetical protein
MYLQQSLKIQQLIGDINGLSTTLHNMGAIAFKSEDWEKAIPALSQSYDIRYKIGSSNINSTLSYMNAIKEKIGEAKYQEIVSKLPNP